MRTHVPFQQPISRTLSNTGMFCGVYLKKILAHTFFCKKARTGLFIMSISMKFIIIGYDFNGLRYIIIAIILMRYTFF